MAQEYRYCWLKLVEVTAATPLRENTTVAEVAAWALRPGGVETLVAAQPYSAAPGFTTLGMPAPPAPALTAVVDSGCRPCPAEAPPDRFMATGRQPLGAMAPAPAPAEGWQIEGTLQAEGAGTADEPRQFFACRPVAGTRDDAVAWLASPEGRDWLLDSSTCVLMSYFKLT
jgi:hypothetical protein